MHIKPEDIYATFYSASLVGVETLVSPVVTVVSWEGESSSTLKRPQFPVELQRLPRRYPDAKTAVVASRHAQPFRAFSLVSMVYTYTIVFIRLK